MFQLSFLIILGLIVFFHLMEQSAWGLFPFLGEFNLACSIPYMNAYLFTLLQIIPLLFLVATLGGGDEKLDSMDTVYYRPESNAEYVWGITLGYTRVFMLASVVSLVLGALIHLLGNNSSFDAWVYLFYLVTLIFPTYVFSYGICLLVKSFVRYRILSLTLLLVYFIITIFFIGDRWGGVLDFTGITLPNAFSEIDGHPCIALYLMQRFAWLLCGLGCIQLSVMGFKRLPNTSGKRTRWMITVFALWGMGIVLLSGVVIEEHEKYLVRQEFREVYDKYSGVKKLTLVNQNIDFRQEGSWMEVKSRLIVRNETGEVIPEIVLYLNPGLEVNSVCIKEKDVVFKRDRQVIVIEQSVKSGDLLELQVAYKGSVDENICYLDMADNVIRDTWQRRYLTCRFGKRYAFLDERFTLLTPEVLWYPVTKPTVNLISPYEGSKDFTRYTLNVIEPGKKNVISQGQRYVRENRVSFRNDVPLVGISLCMGDYETRSVMIDSVECNLFVFRRNTSFFNVIDSCENSLDIDEGIEFDNREYSFSRLGLVETPVSFTSYFREGRMSSEYIQPELVFLPERLVSQVDSPEKSEYIEGHNPQINLYDIVDGILNNNTKTILRNSWINRIIFKRNMKDILLNSFRNTDNPYYMHPLFFEHDAFLQSGNYLIMNTVNRYILNDGFKRYDFGGGTKATVWEALDYLNGHSLREALDDRTLSPGVMQDILILKSLELVNYFNYHGVDTDHLKSFMADYLKEYAFECIDFERFDAEFREKFGMDWMSVLPSWFECKQIPVYLIQDFRVKYVFSDGPYSACTLLVEFSIFNDSDVDGIVSLQTSDSPFYAGSSIVLASLGDHNIKPIRQTYLIKARTGIKVSLHIPESLPYGGLNTGISRNIPRVVAALEEKVDRIEGYEEYVCPMEKTEFLSKENEIIVDNTDRGFRVVEALRFNLREWLAGKTVIGEKPANLYGYVMLNDEWKTLVDNDAYGNYCRSLVARNSGSGESALEWSTVLTKNGKHEILVHVPKFCGMNVMLSAIGHGKRGVQEYTVALPNGEVKKVQVDAGSAEGWISLGIFDCGSGTCKVTLSDKGANGCQIMIGDAVKWVHVGE